MTVKSHHIVGIATALVLPIGVFSSKALAVLLVVAVVAALVVDRSPLRRIAGLPRSMTLLLGAIALLVLASTAWSVTPLDSAAKSMRLIGAFAGALVIAAAWRGPEADDRRMVLRAIALGGAVGVGFLLVEQASEMAIYRSYLRLFRGEVVDPGLVAGHLGAITGLAAVAVWPWLAAVWRLGFRVAAGLAAIAMAVVLWKESSDGPLLAYGLGAAAFGVAYLAPRWTPRVLAAGIVAGILLTPVIVEKLPDPRQDMQGLTSMSMSALHRLAIWHNALALVKKTPVAGIGFDGTRSLYGPDSRVHVTFADAGDGVVRSNWYEPIPLHPHNGFLQIWLELGAIGAVLFAGLFGLLALTVGRCRERYAVATGTAMLTAAAFVAAISFGAWQAWWDCGLILALGGFLAVAPVPARECAA